MSNELVLLEVSENNYPKIYCAGGLDAFYEKAKAEVDGEVPDLSTGKGRARIATLAADVSRSKAAVETPGRAYNKFLKAQPKLIDKELREFCDKMDKLRDDTRAPLTAWEIIDKEEKAQIYDTVIFLTKYEDDHEQAINENELFDLKAAQAEADRQAEIKAASDKAAAEAKAQAEAEAAERIAQSERDKIAAEQREIAAKQAVIDTAKKAAQDAADAKTREAKAKQDAIDAQEREILATQQAETNRILAAQQAKRDAEFAAENAKREEFNRQQAEAAQVKADQEAREANKRHAGGINTKAMNDFISCGLDEASARLAVKALAAGKIRNAGINY
jgi:hypothetical protein